MSTWQEKVEQLRAQQQAKEAKEATEKKARIEKVVKPLKESWKISDAVKKQSISQLLESFYGRLNIERSLRELNQDFWNGRGRILMVNNRIIHYLNYSSSHDGEGYSIPSDYKVSEFHTQEVGYALCLPFTEYGGSDYERGRGIAVLFDQALLASNLTNLLRIYPDVIYSQPPIYYGPFLDIAHDEYPPLEGERFLESLSLQSGLYEVESLGSEAFKVHLPVNNFNQGLTLAAANIQENLSPKKLKDWLDDLQHDKIQYEGTLSRDLEFDRN